MKGKRRIIALLIILAALPYPAWYGVNWYAAGLVDQTQLIEFGMQDDFIYCNDWRPELLDVEKKIELTEPYDEEILLDDPNIGIFNVHTNYYIIAIWDKSSTSYTHLQWAVIYGKVNITKRLLNKNVNINQNDNARRTALHLACLKSNIEIVEMLIKGGAEVNSLDIFRYTPLDNIETLEAVINSNSEYEMHRSKLSKIQEIRDLLINHRAITGTELITQRYLSDLNEVVIPKIQFEDTTMDTVLTFLSQRVNGALGITNPFKGVFIKQPKLKSNKKINYNVENIPLGDAVKEILKNAEIKYYINEKGLFVYDSEIAERQAEPASGEPGSGLFDFEIEQ